MSPMRITAHTALWIDRPGLPSAARPALHVLPLADLTASRRQTWSRLLTFGRRAHLLPSPPENPRSRRRPD